MSYTFSGGILRASVGSPIDNYPLSTLLWFKLADHPIQFDGLFSAGTGTTEFHPAHMMQTANADDRYDVNSYDNTTGGGATRTLQRDNVWTPFMGGWDNDTWRYIRLNEYSNYTASAAPQWALTTGAIDTIAIGGYKNNLSRFVGAIAEVAILQFTPTQAEIESYFSGVAASSIWSARNDYWYYPLNTDQSSHVDESGNGGPTFSLVGTPTYSADHPTITSPTNYLPVTQPLYYGATLLANKTGIEWVMTEGHTGLNGNELGAGTTATTDAGGNLQIPAAQYGTASDPVTLHLYWEEGDPLEDRSLIVKTTLVADT